MRLATQLDLLANHKLDARIVFQGLPISVENKAGATRRGTDPNGKPWATKMVYPYGYLRRTTGVDGDHIDCFIGPHKDAANAYVVNIRKPPAFKAFDEQKVLLGFNSPEDAKRAFLLHYDSPKFFGSMQTIPMSEFKQKALGTMGNPTKLAAAIEMHGWGEPGAYVSHAHLAVIPSVNPPSLKKPFYVPSPNDPREKDDKYGDVSRRRKAQKFRDELSKRHGSDSRDRPVNTTGVSGFPAATIGGFG